MDDLDLPPESPERFANVPTEQLLAEMLALVGDDAAEEYRYWPRVRQLYRRPSRDTFEIAMAWLDSSTPAERRTGADILAQLGTTGEGSPFAEESLDHLVPSLIGESDPDVLAAAAFAIGHLTLRPNRRSIGDEGVSRLLELAEHPDPDVRQGVAHAFSSQATPASISCSSRTVNGPLTKTS